MRTRFPILALLCVLASLLVPGIASAHSAAGAENRVWAFDLPDQIHVLGAAALTLDLHQGCELAEYDCASGSLLAAKGGTALVKAGPGFGKHVLERMAERGITSRMAETALAKGTKFWDPKNKVVNYVLEGGFGSGKDLLVGKNPITGKITTVIRGNNLVRPRFLPLN